MAITLNVSFSEPLFCGSPDKLMNTTITGSDYKTGAVIEYHCPEGHRLIGDKKRKCSSNGFWSGSPPTCKCKINSYQISTLTRFKNLDTNICTYYILILQ